MNSQFSIGAVACRELDCPPSLLTELAGTLAAFWNPEIF